MPVKKILLLVLCLVLANLVQPVRAQFTYGTTGLLQMPTADMQRDKTFMAGAGYLKKEVTPTRWNYDTFNYYINITIFPFLEIGYTCTLHKALKNDLIYGDNYWLPSTYGKFVNQDRNFSVRLRIWKEGWWKPWTPQVVIGGNDVLGNSWTGGSLSSNSSSSRNGFYNRYYLAVTKHFDFEHIGELGAHLAYVYNRRADYRLNGPCAGANFRFSLPPTNFARKALNGLNLMAEYDSRTINIGAEYSFWKDYINAVVEFNQLKYFSGGIVFKVHLK